MPHQGMIMSLRVLIDMHMDHIRRELCNRLRPQTERKQFIVRERREIKKLEALIKELEEDNGDE